MQNDPSADKKAETHGIKAEDNSKASYRRRKSVRKFPAAREKGLWRP